jgi:DNA-binding transcriptional LysR family regulator
MELRHLRYFVAVAEEEKRRSGLSSSSPQAAAYS